MPNIILQRPAIPELLGRHSQPKQIADHILRLLEDGAERRQMLADYDLIRRALGSELPERATERTAQIVEEMLRETTASRPVAAAAA